MEDEVISMELFSYIYISITYIFVETLVYGREHYFDVFYNKNNNNILTDCLRNVLLNGKREILWKIPHKKKNIITDLIDDVLHDVELKRVLIDESIICEKYFFVDTSNFIVITYLDSINKVNDYFKCIKYGKQLLLMDDSFPLVNGLENLFKYLWKNGVVDVTIGVLNEQSKFYTWFPFKQTNYCGETFHLELISNNVNIFPRKIEKYLPNCILKCAWADDKPFTTLYDKTLHLISSKSYGYYVSEDKGVMYGHNFYWEDIIQNMLNKDNFDVVLGYTFINSTDFDYGPMIYSDSSYIGVRKAPKLTEYRPLLRVFNVYLWLSMTFTYVILSIVLITMQRHNRISGIEIFFNLFRVCLGNSLPSVQNLTRTLFITYSTCSFILNTIYLSKLSSLLTKPMYARPMASREDLYFNNLTTFLNYYSEKIYSTIFYASDNPEALKHIFLIKMNQLNLIEMLVNEQNHSAITYLSLLESYPHLTTQIDYFPTFFDETTLFHSYILRRNNPKNIVINFWGTEIVEKGLIIKWWNDMKQISLLKAYRQSLNNNDDSSYTVLALSHLNEMFLIAFYGYVLSLITLLFEFFTNLLMRKINFMKSSSFF